MKKITGVVALLASSLALANDVTVRISEDTVALYLDPQASAANSVQLAMLYNDDMDTALFSAGLFANGQRDGFTGRLGGKAYYADLDHGSGYGVALGGDISFQLNPDLGLTAGLFYGPGSLAFSDVDGYEEWFVKVNYRVFDNALVGAGYTSFDLEPERGRDVKVDDGVFVEMTLRF